MELKILHQKENPLFNRKEIEAEIVTNSIPKRTDLINHLAKEFSTIADAVTIGRIKGQFGSNLFSITATIYESAEHKNKTEIKTKKQLTVEKEAKKKTDEEKKKAKETKTEEKTE